MKKIKSAFGDVVITLALILMSAALLIFPSRVTESAKSAVDTCLYVVIPSLFAFLVVSALASRVGVTEKLGRLAAPIMGPLFHLEGTCAVPLVLGLTGGYPVGTKAAAEMYKNGLCSKESAQRLLGFCNNSGPAFVFGILGASVLGSVKAGAVIYLIHVLTSIFIGILLGVFYRGVPTSPPSGRREKRAPLSSAFIYSVTSSFSSVINVSAFVIFFSVLLTVLESAGIISAAVRFLSGALPIQPEIANSVIRGMAEMTNGVVSINTAGVSPAVLAAAGSFIIGFGGLSVFCQIKNEAAAAGLSVRYVLIGKVLHGVISAILAYFTFSSFAIETAAISSPHLFGRINGGAAAIFYVICACFILYGIFHEKTTGKGGRNNI